VTKTKYFREILLSPVDNLLTLWLNIAYTEKTVMEIMPCLEVAESRRLVRADAKEPGGLLPESAL
jgi:hypothetical protein